MLSWRCLRPTVALPVAVGLLFLGPVTVQAQGAAHDRSDVLALLGTTHVRNDVAVFQLDTVDAFVRAVGTPHAVVWDERIRKTRVELDGPLASVWAEYSFYAGEKFSHCGIDAFQLARDGEAWRIVALTDTRRRDGCPDPPAK
jgi:hypothetical protein